jgi:hypothetical protein
VSFLQLGLKALPVVFVVSTGLMKFSFQFYIFAQIPKTFPFFLQKLEVFPNSRR